LGIVFVVDDVAGAAVDGVAVWFLVGVGFVGFSFFLLVGMGV
jgi:hypothetical protein